MADERRHKSSGESSKARPNHEIADRTTTRCVGGPGAGLNVPGLARKAMAAVLIAMPAGLALGEPVLSVPDVEPNDTVSQAVVTGLVDLGTAIVSAAEIGNGPLGAADRDLFSFEVAESARLPLLLTVAMTTDEPGFDGYVRLFGYFPQFYDPYQPYELANHDDIDATHLDPLLQTYIVEPGTYTVSASHSQNPAFSPTDGTSGRPSAVGGFDLAIIVSEALTPDGTYETQDVPCISADSTPIVIRDQFIGDGGEPLRLFDWDLFCVDVPGPAILRAQVTPTHLGLVDPFVAVGNVGASEHLRRDLKGEATSVAVLEAGSVHLTVYGGYPHFFAFGYYDLFIDVEPVSVQDGPLEPNDSILESTPSEPAGPGSASFTASIGDGLFGAFRGDVDFYRLPPVLDERLEIDVSPTGDPASLIPVVHLYDDIGTHLASWTADKTGVVHGTFERRCRDLTSPLDPDSQVVYAAVMGAKDRPPMDPFAGVTNIPGPLDVYAELEPFYAMDGGPGSTGPYEVTFRIAPTNDIACGQEPDDSIDQLTGYVIEDEGSFTCVRGRLNEGPCNDTEDGVDLFAVRVDTTPKTLDVRLRSRLCGATRVLRVFDRNGEELGLSTDERDDLPDPSIDAFVLLHVVEAGNYYVGVSYSLNSQYDPFFACYGGGDDRDTEKHDQYDLEIRLSAPGLPEPFLPSGGSTINAQRRSLAQDDRLFATALIPGAAPLVELDVTSGLEMPAFSGPEGPFGGGEGLALHDDELFFVGRTSRYPYLYRLDADTGEILERVATWFGSGVFGDLAVLDGVLYLVDVWDGAIYAMPTSMDGTAGRLDAGVPTFGALGSFVLPDRLLVPDARDPSQVHVLRPDDGSLDSTLSLAQSCPCSADMDHDGDVDADDAAFVEDCVGTLFGGTTFTCRPADLNCDGVLDEADLAILDCQKAGPGNPPNDGCCPDELPNVAVRATGLAAVGDNTLVAADWILPELQQFNRIGVPLGSLPLEAPLGKLAGNPVGSFGDGDGNARVDLVDYAVLQRCFGGWVAGLLNRDCETFDFDGDDDVDLFDYGQYLTIVTGGA